MSEQELPPIGQHEEREVRPITDRATALAPGAQLIATGEDTVATGDDFVRVEVATRPEADKGVAEGRHLVPQARYIPLWPVSQKPGQLLPVIEHVAVEGVEHLLVEMFESGRAPKALVEEKGLAQISDSDALQAVAREVLAANPGPVEDFRNGKQKAMGFLVGQMMKATKGQANPAMVNKILAEELARR